MNALPRALVDRFGRVHNYLRLSVTDRCNLRCTYCMPEHDVQFLEKADLITFDEILEVVEIAAEMGVTKIRVTGGEPLIRPGGVGLVADLAHIDGVQETT